MNDDNYREHISSSLEKGRGVLLYFYADDIPDSLDHFPAFQKLAEKHPDKIDVYKINAQENRTLQNIFGVEYAPTTVAIKPEQGVVRTDEVDLKPKAVGRILLKDYKVPWMDLVVRGIAAGKPSLLFFITEWCGYCRMLMPQVERFRSDFGERVNVQIIDTEREKKIADEYLVFGVPVIVIVDSDGLFRDRLSYPAGYDDYVKVMNSIGAKLGKKGG
ncbi:MAG: thioredoxin family protein [bacterium]